MKKILRTLFCLGALASAPIFTNCTSDDDGGSTTNPPVDKPDLQFYGLTSSNSLVKYNANNTASVMSTTPVTGLQAGENLLAIDFRPGTGQLYGLGSSNQLYIINTNSGTATAVGSAFTPAVSGTMVGFDFNPTVDRIRLVTSSGQNLRLHPETGAVAATDGNLNPGTPNIGAAAYTNNKSGASSTELFVIDFTTKMLYKQDPPNDGDLNAIGSLDLTNNPATDGGFDISSENNIALANFTAAGMDHLYQINLTTGKATDLGMLSTSIIGIAIPTSPVAYAVDSANKLHIFNPMAPGTPVSKDITNLQGGESVVGIDMRPVTGQLYALGSTGQLYILNTATGAATAIGASPLPLTGTDFGFDFNPLVDRIRIISDSGQNLRVNPINGDLVATDSALNPGTPAVTGAAYTNSFAGTTSTVLYDIDSTTDMLYKQDPPNAGTLNAVGNLGVNVMETNGFDIGGTSNTGYAILTVGSAHKVYSINLSNGTATAVADFPTSVKGFAVGLGF